MKTSDARKKGISPGSGETRAKVSQNFDKYRAIFHLSPEAICLMDTEGRIIDLNGRIYDIIGYRPEEVIGKHFLELPFFTDEGKRKLVESYARRLQGEEVPPYELEFISKSDERRFGKLIGALMKDRKGNVTGNIVIFSDITDFKAAEEKLAAANKELEETNKRLQRAYKWMRDGRDRVRKQLYQEETGFLIDSGGRIEGATEKAVEIAGREKSQLIGVDLADLLEADSREGFRRELKQAWKGIANRFVVDINSVNGRKSYQLKMIRLTMEERRLLLVILQ